jgi:hypothetical protein
VQSKRVDRVKGYVQKEKSIFFLKKKEKYLKGFF